MTVWAGEYLGCCACGLFDIFILELSPEAYGRADSVTDDDAHDDAEDPAQAQEEALLDEVEATDHDDDVDEDDEVAHQKHARVLEGLRFQGLEEHLGHECEGRHILRLLGSVRHNLQYRMED